MWCYGLINSGTGFGSDTQVAYTTARHKKPQEHANWSYVQTQSEGTEGSVKLLFSIYLSFADNKFKAIWSLGKQIVAWRHPFVLGGKLESMLWPGGLVLVLCCNAPRPPCSSDSIDSALPVNAHYNINPAPFGPVTLNTFTLIVTQQAGYATILSWSLYTWGWHTIACRLVLMLVTERETGYVENT